MTARALIESSLRLLGVLASGESLPAASGADALVTLSQMLDSWSTERLTIYAQSRTVHALTVGQQRYTIGSGGDFAEARPLWIDTATLIVDGRERPIRVSTRDEWARISDKDRAGEPEGVFYNPAYPLGTFDVWPVPDAACSLVLYAPAASLTSVASLATVLSVPPGWSGALRYNLAVELAAEYDEVPSPIVVQFAVDKKADIKRTNILDDEMRIDPALLRRRTINRATGEYW